MNISQLLIEFGYTEIQILKILNTYPLNHLSEDKLYSNIVRNYNYLLEKGYSEKEWEKEREVNWETESKSERGRRKREWSWEGQEDDRER